MLLGLAWKVIDADQLIVGFAQLTNLFGRRQGIFRIRAVHGTLLSPHQAYRSHRYGRSNFDEALASRVDDRQNVGRAIDGEDIALDETSVLHGRRQCLAADTRHRAEPQHQKLSMHARRACVRWHWQWVSQESELANYSCRVSYVVCNDYYTNSDLGDWEAAHRNTGIGESDWRRSGRAQIPDDELGHCSSL